MNGILDAPGSVLAQSKAPPGTRLWEFARGRLPPLRGYGQAHPAVGADGTVYVTANQAGIRVYALDGATGLPRWAVGGFRGNTPSSPALAADGTLHLATNTDYATFAETNSTLYALDAATGARRWDYATGTTGVAGGPRDGPAIREDGVIFLDTGTQLSSGRPSFRGDVAMHLLAIQGTAGLAATPWPKYRGDAQNTGRVRVIAPSSPSLRFDLGTGGLTLHWEGAGFRLQTTTDLTSAALWQDLPGPVTNRVNLPIDSAGQRFYRLRATPVGQRFRPRQP